MRNMGFKVYRQIETADCGLACIRMVCNYHGKKISLRALRELSELNRLGISIGEIKECLESLGFDSFVVRLSYSHIEQTPLPAILLWDNNHYVVLYKIDHKKQRYYIADPAEGKLCLSAQTFKDRWGCDNDTGFVVVSEPNESFVPKPDSEEKSQYKLFRFMLSTYIKHKRQIALIFLFSLVCIICDICFPLIFQRTIDEGLKNRDIELVWLLASSQFFIFIGNGVFSNCSKFFLSKTSTKIGFSMMERYLAKLIMLPMSFFDRNINSSLIQKSGDQLRIKEFILQIPQKNFFLFLNFIVFSSMMLWYNAYVFLLFCTFSSLEIIWGLLYVNNKKSLEYSMFNEISENHQLVYELVNGMPDIKSSSAQDMKIRDWKNSQSKINASTIKGIKIDILSSSGLTFFARLKDILITAICTTMVINDQMSLGVLMTISYIAGRLSAPISEIVNSYNSYQNASISYERINEIMDSPYEKATPLRVESEKILLDNIWFKYPGKLSPWVFKGLSCCIPRGKTTAIVGESGAGKTTLMKILLGFYSINNGSIILGNQCLKSLDHTLWINECSAVLQDGFIFSASVLKNIALSDERPDEEKALKACKIAEIDKFVESLPLGIHTKIGNSGLNLSGGQKQRILIARALYKKSAFIFFDEATSSLDASNETMIVKNLMEMKGNQTFIISAHRLSTVRNADNIIFLKDGIISEQGTHEELLKIKGDYYSLVQNQL